MPQAAPEHAARWQDPTGKVGSDQVACSFLEGVGYKSTRHWAWILPTPTHIPTDKELDAINFLINEWDWDGIIPTT